MQKLGLMDLSLKLKACTAPPKRTPRTSPSSTKHPTPFLPRGPLRRSSRLQNSTPVSYSEVALTKKDGLLEDENITQEVGSKPETYTEEHEKLLGNTEKSWTLFVDGCGKDGKRIYDSINGKTCHQCRDALLMVTKAVTEVLGVDCGGLWWCSIGAGERLVMTRLGVSKMLGKGGPGLVSEVIGVFGTWGEVCGEFCCSKWSLVEKGAENSRLSYSLLQMRDGPGTVLWRLFVHEVWGAFSAGKQKGGLPLALFIGRYQVWATSRLHTISSKPNAHKTLPMKFLRKRSLPFANMEVVSEESLQLIYKTAEQLEHKSEDKILDEFKSKTENKISGSRNLANDGQTKRALTFSGSEVKSENVESAKVNPEVHENLGLSKPRSGELNNEFEKEKHMQSNGNRATACQTEFSGSKARSKKVESAGTHEIDDHGDLALSMSKFEVNIPSESCRKQKGKRASAINPSPDSIAARLRQRHRKSSSRDDAELMGVDEKNSDVKPAVNTMSSSQNIEEENEMHVEDDKPNAVLESSQLKKRPRAAEPSPDSIGARLRQRRRLSKGHENELPGTNGKT
ncbi:hypothetical protein OIU84_029975 [Salix udensis]|uniref:Uncharacterized protein n=1 Tax=Salix udensis TaxID=889485 RepID=A0AAD6KAI9_9ROSI|nr:hypothetical protein OIU84_029975 [Salix udensis]